MARKVLRRTHDRRTKWGRKVKVNKHLMEVRRREIADSIFGESINNFSENIYMKHQIESKNRLFAVKKRGFEENIDFDNCELGRAAQCPHNKIRCSLSKEERELKCMFFNKTDLLELFDYWGQESKMQDLNITQDYSIFTRIEHDTDEMCVMYELVSDSGERLTFSVNENDGVSIDITDYNKKKEKTFDNLYDVMIALNIIRSFIITSDHVDFKTSTWKNINSTIVGSSNQSFEAEKIKKDLLYGIHIKNTQDLLNAANCLKQYL